MQARIKMSQRELAHRVGVRQATISDLERGAQQETSTEIARRLAYKLGVTLDWLIGPSTEDEEGHIEPTALATA